MTILQDLFYGNIDLNAGGFDRDSEYGKAMQAVTENEEKLLALLNHTETKLFVVFSDAQSKLNSITAEENFIQGFKLGALIIMKIIGG